MKRYNIIMVYNQVDFTYYDSDSILELYVCRLLHDVELVPEPDGNELAWVPIEGTDFGNTEIFGGDGNILHCHLMAERNKKTIFSEESVTHIMGGHYV